MSPEKKSIAERIEEQTEGLIHLKDRDTLLVLTDQGEIEVHRQNKLLMHPGSGLAQYGAIIGDWRMIAHIFEDCQDIFNEVDGI